jgi:hypothetical protein
MPSTESSAEERLRAHARSGSTLRVARHQLVRLSSKSEEFADPYREGMAGGHTAQSENIATAAHPLAERQSLGREASDGEPRQMDAGSGRGNLVHTGYQIRSSVIAQKARL